jgi:hypothetical protein
MLVGTLYVFSLLPQISSRMLCMHAFYAVIYFLYQVLLRYRKTATEPSCQHPGIKDAKR